MAVPGTSTAAYAELLEKNRRYLWNPFTQMKAYLAEEPVVIERGEGVKLFDVNGVEYYDGNSSLWVNVHGHNRPELNEAIARQLEQISHSTLLGMANVPAVELAERLVALTPDRLRKVFFSDSGATAVEIGLKVAFAYWRRVGRPEKSSFVAFDNGYHGDTIGSMSVGGIDLFHSEFGPLLFECERVTFPHAYRFPGTEEECSQRVSCRARAAVRRAGPANRVPRRRAARAGGSRHADDAAWLPEGARASLPGARRSAPGGRGRDRLRPDRGDVRVRARGRRRPTS